GGASLNRTPNPAITVSTALCSGFLVAALAIAQSPIGPEIRITDRQLSNFPVGLVYTTSGTLVAGFQEDTFDSVSPDPISQAAIMRRLAPEGGLGPEEEIVRFGENGFLRFRSLLALPDGTFEALYDTQDSEARFNLSVIRFDTPNDRIGEFLVPS